MPTELYVHVCRLKQRWYVGENVRHVIEMIRVGLVLGISFTNSLHVYQ